MELRAMGGKLAALVHLDTVRLLLVHLRICESG